MMAIWFSMSARMASLRAELEDIRRLLSPGT